ncbi:hypothetical protein [Prosthecobacter sp.]|uniref:hypothetical protein n=1 Tax=Prosthecobacter sp. TaxID=1965333 RepID=UPI003784A093
MSFLLSENRTNDLQGYWKRYEEYLKAEGHRMPPGALKLALSPDWYDFSVHSCPHDAWLEECRIIESDPAGKAPRFCRLEVKLLGAYHDGTIRLRYPRLFGYSFQSSKCEQGMNDWLYDEFRLSENGRLLHEIEWANGGRWLIEADDIEFEWCSFKKVEGSP